MKKYKTRKEINFLLTKEFLTKEHIDNQKSLQQISKSTNLHIATIKKKLLNFGILIHYWETEKWDKILTKEFLIEEHINKQLSMEQIAKKVGCDGTTIKYRLKKSKISINYFKGKKERSSKEYDKILTKEFLEENYTKNLFSMSKIAKIIECDIGTIKNRLIKNNFKIRTIGEIHKGGKQSEQHIKNRLKAIFLSPNQFEQKCLRYLNISYPNKFKYTGDGSFIVQGRNPDAYSEELNIVCLFQGDYYHCNPRKYPNNYYSRYLKVEEIRKHDQEAIELFKQAGYQVIVIWEDEIRGLLCHLELNEIIEEIGGIKVLINRINKIFEGKI
jgi:G:T-mismatch repair DNA endonuclease (very short patch repair protein)